MKSKTKKKKNPAIYAAVVIGILIVSSTIFFVYSNDQAKIRGQMFGNELKQIQDDLKKITIRMIQRFHCLKKETLIGRDF